MIPTVGFNMRKVTKGKVTIKLWDLGGQVRLAAARFPTLLTRLPRPSRRRSRLSLSLGRARVCVWPQPRFRSMWERYCRGVSAIVYVVDSADADNITTSKSELHDLLAKPALEGIPTLILGNKNDLPTSVGVDELIERLGLKSLANREVCCYSISAKNSVNIDITMDWLIKHSKASTSR